MNKNKSRGRFIMLGLVGVLLVLIGLDLYSYNYSEKLLANMEEMIKQYDDNFENDVESREPESSIIESPRQPTKTTRPINTVRQTSTTSRLPTNTAAVAPSSTTAPAITPSPTGESWRPCPGIYSSHLHIGDQAFVSYEPPFANRVRKNPNTSAQVLGKIQPGEEVDIMDGPGCSNGWVWWKVSSREQSLVGWTSEGDGQDYWLIKIEN